jgi:hypothetical protein
MRLDSGHPDVAAELVPQLVNLLGRADRGGWAM